MDPFAVSGAMRDMVPHRLPLVPGFDYAGDIEAVGAGVETLRVGDDVFGPVGKMVFGEGSWAEFVTVSADSPIRLPMDSMRSRLRHCRPRGALRWRCSMRQTSSKEASS
jgi:NADPH:quinone reductase-like Zn-dependent oxidoreductase